MSAVTERTPGQVIVVTRNAVAEAVATIAGVAGRPVVVLDADDPEGTPLERLRSQPPGPLDAVVLTDHDAPDTDATLREALRGPAGYVAMLASRTRAAALLPALRDEGFDEPTLARLHVPAGLDTGGRSPGEIALSVVAQVVAWGNGRSGGPMRPA